MEKVKNIIIGFGKGGKTLAKFLGQRGEEVIVVEKSKKMYGGACINIACLPSKRLIFDAEKGLDFSQSVADKNEMTASFRNKNYHLLADEPTVTVLDGTAKFIADHQIEVATDKGLKQYEGQRIFINTGSVAKMPPIPGLHDSKFVLDSTMTMEERQLPQKFVIIGAGYIGLEFASMFAQFGSEVTVLDHHAEFMPSEDKDIADEVKQDLEAAGVKFELGVNIKQIIDHEQEAEVMYEKDHQLFSIRGSKIVAATGRQANTFNLGLENTDIKTLDNGAIKVDEYLKTNVENVWAIGDVKGGLQFTYISLDDFRIIRDQLLGIGKHKTTDRKNVPFSIFINPPLSKIGINERQAKAMGIDVTVKKLKVAAIPKATVNKNSKGILKAIIDAKTDQIFGCTLYGIESHELINMISLAMNQMIPATVLREQIYTHPSMSEAFNNLF